MLMQHSHDEWLEIRPVRGRLAQNLDQSTGLHAAALFRAANGVDLILKGHTAEPVPGRPHGWSRLPVIA